MNLRCTIPSLSGIPIFIGSIHTRLVLNPKMPKEPSSPSRSNAQKINIAAKIRNDNNEMINGQLVTAGHIQCPPCGTATVYTCDRWQQSPYYEKTVEFLGER